jgi:hypothetical protein
MEVDAGEDARRPRGTSPLKGRALRHAWKHGCMRLPCRRARTPSRCANERAWTPASLACALRPAAALTHPHVRPAMVLSRGATTDVDLGAVTCHSGEFHCTRDASWQQFGHTRTPGCGCAGRCRAAGGERGKGRQSRGHAHPEPLLEHCRHCSSRSGTRSGPRHAPTTSPAPIDATAMLADEVTEPLLSPGGDQGAGPSGEEAGAAYEGRERHRPRQQAPASIQLDPPAKG